MEILADNSDFKNHSKVDRIGIFASILCAVHCALTPVLLIMLPTFGKAWAHPSTHWGMALVVIPIAIFMMRKGYKTHSKKWILVVGSLGVAFIIAGAILPYIELGDRSTNTEQAQSVASTTAGTEESNLTEAAAPG
jgi:hypothetical protein